MKVEFSLNVVNQCTISLPTTQKKTTLEDLNIYYDLFENMPNFSYLQKQTDREDSIKLKNE